ncbi:hypothetical protein [Microlunatus sp. GCM10028923]|uniref:hypothetical protein n=1 Tax=Microlunatus sp. GCM10028923 TaxID=3273400 RepID=UPI00362439DF
MADRRALLQDQWADSCARLGRLLTALTDAEFFWEPCGGCWTVHRRTETRAANADGSGTWVIDYEDLDGESRTNWGETWPTARIFTTLIKEQTHHGAEIGVLRDLYRNRDNPGSGATSRLI